MTAKQIFELIDKLEFTSPEKSELESEHDIVLDGEHLREAFNYVIEIAEKPNAQPETGVSRFGGEPDLPDDIAWPDELAFLAQVNFAELRKFDLSGLIPAQGMLYLFSDETVTETKMLFSPAAQNLVRRPYPDGMEVPDHKHSPRDLKFRPNFYFGFPQTIGDSMAFMAIQKALPAEFTKEMAKILGAEKHSPLTNYFTSRFFGGAAEESAMEEEIFGFSFADDEDETPRTFLFQLDNDDGMIIAEFPLDDMKKGDFGNGKFHWSGT